MGTWSTEKNGQYSLAIKKCWIWRLRKKSNNNLFLPKNNRLCWSWKLGRNTSTSEIMKHNTVDILRGAILVLCSILKNYTKQYYLVISSPKFSVKYLTHRSNLVWSCVKYRPVYRLKRPSALRRRYAAAYLLRLWVRISWAHGRLSLVSVVYVVMWRCLREADHPSRAGLLNVECLNEFRR